MSHHVDLLPESVVNRRYTLSCLKVWTFVWLLTAFATLYFCVVQNHRLRDMEIRAKVLSAATAPLKKLQNELTSMQDEVKSIRERESWLVESDSQQTLQLMGIISHAAARNDGRINVQNMTLASIERPVETGEPKPTSRKRKSKDIETEHRMQLTLSGYAVDDLSVASFVAGLREAGVFESVELKSSESQLFQNHETRQYDVSCIY